MSFGEVQRLEVGSTTVNSWVVRPVRASGPDVVVVPGLGALGYLSRFAAAIAASGSMCHVLDVPGFGSAGPDACAPSVPAMADTVSAWLTERGLHDVVLAGHSTGAQAAIQAARGHSAVRAVAALGLPFPPGERSWTRVLLTAPAAFRRDSPAEFAAALPQYLRGNLAVLRLIASGLRARPERDVAGLTVPLVLASGAADAYSPAWWLEAVATQVKGPGTVLMLPGSHNALWVHPDAAARAVLLTDALALTQHR